MKDSNNNINHALNFSINEASLFNIPPLDRANIQNVLRIIQNIQKKNDDYDENIRFIVSPTSADTDY